MKGRDGALAKARESQQVCILVLGMHRSGTSALTRMLNLLGCALPGDLLGANYSNPEGHWESLRAIEINDCLLGALGRRWDDIRELPVDWLKRPETDFARQQIRAFVDREISSEKLSVLKEPRLCHLAPLWIEVLEEAGIDVRVIIPVRHPAEVAYSLARRDGMAVGRSLLMWIQHLLDAEAASRGQRRVLSHFHELLIDWRAQADRFSAALGVTWPRLTDETASQIDEFLRPGLRHADARSGEDVGSRMTLPPLLLKLYEDIVGLDDKSAWQAILSTATKVAEVSNLYSPSIAEIAQRLERSEQELSAANRLLTTSIADRERRQQSSDLTAKKVAEIGPLLVGIIGQFDAQRETILPAISRQADQIDKLTGILEVERGVRAELVTALTERDRLASELSGDLASRAGEIIQLTDKLMQAERRIASLQRAAMTSAEDVDQLTRRLSMRTQLAAEQDQRIALLTGAVEAAEDGIRKMLASRSWRITRPLRLLSNFLNGSPEKPPAGVLDFNSASRIPSSDPDGMLACLEHTGFDANFYLQQYPDIAEAGIDAYQHFIEHGRAEGRQGSRPKLSIRRGGVAYDSLKETVIVVSHEASRTGAPVLSLNIVHGLQERYNVVTLLLGEGPLEEAFLEEGSILAGPIDVRGIPLSAKLVVDQLLDLFPAKFAIVNSIESRVVLEPLARRGVPTVSLVHEFAAYTRPKHAFRDAVFWAGETIFSTPITHENAVLEFPELKNTPFNIIPQGRCSLLTKEVDAASQAEESARVRKALRPSGSPADAIVVLGAGFVQQRKGVDLFIKCAAKVLEADAGKHCRFVWIGKGYDPENDMGYSVYLADQLRRSGLERKVIIMDETSSITAAYDAADILLISSRLDPLPNVAIDAMAHGLPVICFERTTGIANYLEAAGLSDFCVSPYLDTADMAAKVVALASSATTRFKVGERVRQLVSEEFDMARYIEQLEGVAARARIRSAARERDAESIVASGLIRPDYFPASRHGPTSLVELVEFEYLRSWDTGIGRRKLYPGFHPGIYLEQHGTAEPLGDPLADFLRAGQPDGPWSYELITSADEASAIPPTTRIALHLHIFYADMLPDMLRRLGLNSVRPDLFVSVPSAQVAEEIEAILGLYAGSVVDVQVVPNRGRDIGPLLTAFGPGLVDDYDLIGHLHTKKSADIKDEAFGRNWHEFLIGNLLGGESNMADTILGRMAADPSIGMVFPDDPYVVGWGGNLPFAEALGQKLGLSNFPEHFLFPVGTMFWARVEAIRPIFDLDLQWSDYPVEPLPYDGSKLHALERIFPLVAASRGGRSVLTNVVGVTR